LAVNTILVGVAKLIWGFEIRGAGGGGVDVGMWGSRGGILVRPKEFGIVFRVRSQVYREVIVREAEGDEIFD
jgi:hypothetical protein